MNLDRLEALLIGYDLLRPGQNLERPAWISDGNHLGLQKVEIHPNSGLQAAGLLLVDSRERFKGAIVFTKGRLDPGQVLENRQALRQLFLRREKGDHLGIEISRLLKREGPLKTISSRETKFHRRG